MNHPDTGRQPRRHVLGLRASDEEKELLEWYAEIRGETVTDILRQMGMNDAVALARQVQERFAS